MADRIASPARLRVAAFLSGLIAAGWLLHLSWLPRFLSDVNGAFRAAAAFMLVLNGLQMYVLLTLRLWLAVRGDTTSPGHYLVAYVAVLAADLLGNCYLLISGVPGYQVYTSPLGPYMLLFAYPLLTQLALGVVLIAFGYSVLRTAQDRDATLRWYGYLQIAAGFSVSSLAFAPLAALPLAAGYLLLVQMLWRAGRTPEVPRVRHASGRIKPNVTISNQRDPGCVPARGNAMHGAGLAATSVQLRRNGRLGL